MPIHLHTLLFAVIVLTTGCERSSDQRIAMGGADAIRQSRRNTCGPAALAMLLMHQGRPTTEGELALLMAPGPDGVTLSTLLETSAAFGVPLEAWRLRLDTLRLIRTPAILWVDGDHFVVFDSVTSAGAHLRDPSAGRVVVPLERLRVRWDGTAAVVAGSP